MFRQYSYSYLQEAVKAHLDLEEDELELMNINSRFHIFANEAMQHICHSRPKYKYFEFEAVTAFAPLIYDDGVLRLATYEEQLLSPASLATFEETAEWYNKQGIYLVGQVIPMPDDFITFIDKRAFMWTNSIVNKVTATKTYMTYMSNNEILVLASAFYMIPYAAIWTVFSQDTDVNLDISMPSDLALTIPIYVASVILQQRNLNMANAKRQEFELALSRCKASNVLENKEIKASFV